MVCTTPDKVDNFADLLSSLNTSGKYFAFKHAISEDEVGSSLNTIILGATEFHCRYQGHNLNLK